MTRLPVCSGAEAIRAFARAGWIEDRRRGSHVTLIKPGTIAILTVPLFEEVTQLVGDIHCPGGSSQFAGRHLPGNQDVDLTSAVLVVRQTLVHLCARQVREAVGDEAVDRLAVLQ